MPDLILAARTARRAGRSGLAWGAVFGVYVASSAASYATTYPTAAARATFSRSLAANPGLAALFGPPHRLDTVAGFTSWRCMGGAGLIGAVWGLLLATRLTRGEEDQGRWELYLAGRTTRRRAAGQAVAGLAAGLAALWAVTAAATVAVGSTPKVGFSFSASVFFATGLVADAVMFVGVGVVAAQLAGTRRLANGISAAALGAAFAVRVIADSDAGRAWLRWATPLGWAEELRPLTGSRPVALLPIAALVVALAAAAVVVAGRRDVGAGVLPDRTSRPARDVLLGGPTRVELRLSIGLFGGWVLGLGLMGFVFGMVAQSAAGAISGSATIQRAIARLGGHRAGAATYLGIAFLVAAALVAFAAAGQVAATRREEADGRLDTLLVLPVGRYRWLAGRTILGAALILLIGLVAGVASWAGAATQHSGVGFGGLVEAGLNIVAPALFVLGVGTLLYGVWPRRATSLTYAVVGWSFLVDLVGSAVKSNRLLLDTSVLTHITPAPAASPNWAEWAGLAALGLAAAVLGGAGFRRRDLQGAG